ncbi:MAG: hypothetical protein JNJ58_07125 [Chitinophagaceae bacterium]|nr:hypothetical protein [Chitinophagaceae bacterium]
MKNLLILGLILLLGACKKDRICECKTAAGIYPVKMDNSKKSDAKELCDQYSKGIYAATGGCVLK